MDYGLLLNCYLLVLGMIVIPICCGLLVHWHHKYLKGGEK